MSERKMSLEMQKYIEENFEREVLAPLKEFIKIPNVSRNYDPTWETNGLMDQACNFVIDFANKAGLEGFSVELIKEKGLTNAILGVVEKKDAPTALLYGHIDKQPPLTDKWREGLHPYQPVVENGRLYGRGGADDGYAFFACVFIAKVLQKFGLQRHRMVFFFECDEESGSRDLVHYLNSKAAVIGDPAIMVCLDSGTVDYDHLSFTTSLRGLLNFQVSIDVSKEGVHSGSFGGVVPDSSMIMRDVLNQFQDAKSGRLIEELYVNIPKDKYEQACDLIDEIPNIDFKAPLLDGVSLVSSDKLQLYLNKNWRPSCTLTGFGGLPQPSHSGNVINTGTTYVFNIRLPPSLSDEEAHAAVKKYFTEFKVPYNAKLVFHSSISGSGLNCNAFSEKLKRLIREAALEHYGKVPLFTGEGGSIPFLNEFQKKFPQAEFLIAGVLGPESNAHGPNEFLDIDFLQKLIKSFVHIFSGF